MAKTNRAGQKHAKYMANASIHAAEQLRKIARENPGKLMAAIAEITGDTSNGITPAQASQLIRKFLFKETTVANDAMATQ